MMSGSWLQPAVGARLRLFRRSLPWRACPWPRRRRSTVLYATQLSAQEFAMTHEVEQSRETPEVWTSRVIAALASTLALVLVALCGLYFFYRASAPDASLIPP